MGLREAQALSQRPMGTSKQPFIQSDTRTGPSDTRSGTLINVAQAFHKVQGGADTIGREMAHTAMNEVWRNAGENRRSRSKSENFLGPQELGVERFDFQNVALVRLRELDDLPARQREAPDVVELRANATPME